MDAARELRFPVVVKVNIGGSGAGIIRFDTLAGLQAAVDNNQIDLGIDQTALVQEKIYYALQYYIKTYHIIFYYSPLCYIIIYEFNFCCIILYYIHSYYIIHYYIRFYRNH